MRELWVCGVILQDDLWTRVVLIDVVLAADCGGEKFAAGLGANPGPALVQEVEVP